MVRYSVLILATLLTSCATPTWAQRAPKIACSDGNWSIQTPDQLVAHDLTEKVAVFSQALDAARSRDVIARMVKLYVSDCPIFGHTVRAIKQHSGMGGGAMKILPSYGIYASVALIRNTDQNDLVHLARRQACIVMLNIADDPHRAEDSRLPESAQIRIQTCELQEAVNADDTEYANWLTKRLGVSLPQKQAQRSLLQKNDGHVREAVDFLRSLPGGHPAKTGIDQVEELRRSFQEFPPRQPK